MTSPYYIKSNTVVRYAPVQGRIPVGRRFHELLFFGESVAMSIISISVVRDIISPSITTIMNRCTEPRYLPGTGRMEYPACRIFANGSSSASKAREINAGISIIGHWSCYNAKKP